MVRVAEHRNEYGEAQQALGGHLEEAQHARHCSRRPARRGARRGRPPEEAQHKAAPRPPPSAEGSALEVATWGSRAGAQRRTPRTRGSPGADEHHGKEGQPNAEAAVHHVPAAGPPADDLHGQEDQLEADAEHTTVPRASPGGAGFT